MKITFLFFLAFASLSAKAVTLDCQVSRNNSGIAEVSFGTPLSVLGDFKDMTVSFLDGTSDEYTTGLSTTVRSSTDEAEERSIFRHKHSSGRATLSYTFFVLPEDQNDQGFSIKNGARMKLIIPPAVEEVRLLCIRRL